MRFQHAASFLALSLGLAALSHRAAAAPFNVVLTGQRIALKLGEQPPTLEVGLTVRNGLGSPLSGVEVGVIFADGPAALESVSSARDLYLGKTSRAEVGVVRRSLVVDVPANGEAALSFHAPLAAGSPEPAVYFTHLLGYRLARAPAELLFALLETDVPADEVAVVDYLGVAGDEAARWRARQRHAGDAALSAGLAKRLSAAVPERPSLEETRARVLALRGLGVLGGTEARSSLDAAGPAAGLAAFDETLQVLRVARVVGSRLENPLAFAVPAEARSLADVLAAARADLDGLREPITAVAPPAEPGPQALEPNAPAEAAPSPTAAAAPILVGAVGGAALVLMVVGVLLGLRARRRQKGERP